MTARLAPLLASLVLAPLLSNASSQIVVEYEVCPGCETNQGGPDSADLCIFCPEGISISVEMTDGACFGPADENGVVSPANCVELTNCSAVVHREWFLGVFMGPPTFSITLPNGRTYDRDPEPGSHNETGGYGSESTSFGGFGDPLLYCGSGRLTWGLEAIGLSVETWGECLNCGS